MSDTELSKHTQDAISDTAAYLAELQAGDANQKKKAQLLGYWISDYIKFLRKEVSFNPGKLIRYKRGSIVKAHFGYRIGSEEGGLHYAIVVDRTNKMSSRTVTVVPLTSVKPHTDLSSLHHSKIPLGNELFTTLNQKLTESSAAAKDELSEIMHTLSELLIKQDSSDAEVLETREKLGQIRTRLDAQFQVINNLEKVENELKRMKEGSIALVGQITTISKIRIYDPLYPSDPFSNIRISDESLDKIDQKIIELYTGKSK